MDSSDLFVVRYKTNIQTMSEQPPVMLPYPRMHYLASPAPGANMVKKSSLWPISRQCTFPPAHLRLILLIHDFSLVIGGKLHSELYLFFSLLVANYSRNIPFFSSLAARLQTHTICSLNIQNNSLYNAY